jgi:rod shape-determining protein MreD
MVQALPLAMRGAALMGVAALLSIGVSLDLAPLSGAWRAWPMPDLLLCMVLVLAIRRPWLMPVLLVFAAGLLRDLLSGGPVGPGALLLALVSETVSRRHALARRHERLGEGLVVALAAAVVVVVPAVMLWMVLAEAPGWGALWARWLATLVAYPVVAILLPVRWVRSSGATSDRLRGG